MATINIPVEFDIDHRRCIVGTEPMIFHCHHYNTYLLQTIFDADYIDSEGFLIGAGAEMAYGQLSGIFREENINTIVERKSFAEEIYKWAGFGLLDFSTLDESGGISKTKYSHYAVGWRSKWNEAKKPVCQFASGWLAGALAAVYDKPNGYYAVRHDTCSAVGANDTCIFELSAGNANYKVFTSVGVGALSEHKVRPIPANNVDYDGILNAVASMDLTGKDNDGFIRAFGVMLTRHYANYYNRISFEFVNTMLSQFGDDGREVAEPLLKEAGRACAFNTYGGIMTSTEWDALILPSLKTKEDWAHGLMAVNNAFGWGRYQITSISEKEAEFVIHDDYESVGYNAMYGKSNFSVSYLAQGGVEGLMTLVYISNIMSKPDLTPEFYEKTFRSERKYVAEAITSRAKGDEVTTFRVSLVGGN